MKAFKKYSLAFWLYALVFIAAPIILILFFTFTTATRTNFTDFEFTLNNIQIAFESVYIKVILISLRIALITTLICLVIGYLTAYFITKVNQKYQSIILILIVLPMWMNMLLRTYAWRSILINNGILNQILDFLNLGRVEILNTEIAVIFGMVYNFLPFMIFPIYNSLRKMDNDLIIAAKDLGASKLKIFLKVIFPLSLPGVISGIVLVFMPSATSFVIPTYLGGGKIDLIGNIIERQFNVVGNWNLGSALSLIVLTILIITTLFLYQGEKKYVTKN